MGLPPVVPYRFLRVIRLCETIGPSRCPCCLAGMSCQNTSQGPGACGSGRHAAYIDEVLGLITTSATPIRLPTSGPKARRIEPYRAVQSGVSRHRQPEDLIDDVFKNRFQQIFDAVKAHLKSPWSARSGLRRADRTTSKVGRMRAGAGIPIVDEHSYQSSSWWFHNLDHYDPHRPQGAEGLPRRIRLPGTPSSSAACPKRRSWAAWN